MTNRISEYRGRKHSWWNHCDKQGDRCTVEWVKTWGSRWRGLGPQIRGPLPSPAVSIKPRHTGNNLWTWPSNSPALPLNPGSQPLPPPNHIKPTPRTPPTLRPTTHSTFWQDKLNASRANYMDYVCMLSNRRKCAHTLAQTIRSLCSHWGVSGYSSAQAQRWVIKKSNTVNAQGHQHINI